MKSNVIKALIGGGIVVALVIFHEPILDALRSGWERTNEWWGNTVDRDRTSSERIEQLNEAADIGAGLGR